MKTKNLPESWFEANWPAPANIIAFTTSRQGIGYKQNLETSEGYRAFNLALHVHDQEQIVVDNRKKLAALCSLTPGDFHWLEQVHSNTVVKIDDLDCTPQADASYTRSRREACVVMTADCLPVLFCNKQGTQVAAAHAGWRGLASGILRNTVERFDSPEDTLVWLGPAIGQDAFEVGNDVYHAFCKDNPEAVKAFSQSPKPGKWHADLYHLARIELSALGVTQIFGGEHCTYSEVEHFYSYRRDGKISGRMASVIYMKVQTSQP